MHARLAARLARRAVSAPPMLWLGLFFLAPFAIVLKIALSDSAPAQPPYAPHWPGLAGVSDFLAGLDGEMFGQVFEDTLYLSAYLGSLRLAALATLLTLLIGFPLAYAMATAPRRWQTPLIILVILPFWTSFLIRVYAWIAILRPEGVLDAALMGLGITSAPLQLLNSETAVLIGLTYSYLPFMVLPIYAALEKLDRSVIEAAADLGAPPWKRLLTITVPLAKPGLVAGIFLVFVPAIGEFVVPDLLGGSDTLMIGKVIWTEFFSNRDWPLASAIAIILLVGLVAPILLFQRLAGRAAP